MAAGLVSCVLTPEQTEGPHEGDLRLVREGRGYVGSIATGVQRGWAKSR